MYLLSPLYPYMKVMSVNTLNINNICFLEEKEI